MKVNWGKVNWGNVPQWILVFLAVLAFIVALFTEKLPTTKRIENVVTNVNRKLLKDTQEFVRDCVHKCVKEGADRLTVRLVIFRNNPELARNNVYQEALEQANKSKYVFLFEGYYMTAAPYRDEEWRLLTRSERDIVENYCKGKEEGPLRLLDMLLSEYPIAKQLSID